MRLAFTQQVQHRLGPPNKLGRCSVVQTLSWSVVQAALNVAAVLLRNVSHAATFRKVLPNQSVRVLVCATLPRMLRRCEVVLHFRLRLQHLVIIELGAVIERDGLEQTSVLSDHFYGRLARLLLAFASARSARQPATEQPVSAQLSRMQPV